MREAVRGKLLSDLLRRGDPMAHKCRGWKGGSLNRGFHVGRSFARLRPGGKRCEKRDAEETAMGHGNVRVGRSSTCPRHSRVLHGKPARRGTPIGTTRAEAAKAAKTRQASAAKASKKAAAKKAPVKASRKAARKGAAKRPRKAAAPPPAIPAATE